MVHISGLSKLTVMWIVSFHRLATREVTEARQYYFARNPRVADRFQIAVNAAVRRIRDDPLSLPADIASFRRIRVRRFPYLLVFEISSQSRVLVIAAAHTSRRAGYWRRRSESGE